MGKLDVTVLRYMTNKNFDVLAAIERGMNKQELISEQLVGVLAHLKHGGANKILRELCKHRLLAYDGKGKKNNGYRLTNSGYDYLALKVLARKDIIYSFGSQMGVGKESNIYKVMDKDGHELCLKIHRLGRTFKCVKEKRDYHGKRSHANWLHLAKISATKEFSYMSALHEKKFPVPCPIGVDRHCVVMELVEGATLNQIRDLEMDQIEKLYEELMEIIVKFASCGVIHGDFNEFNIMITDETKPVIIDFPQMISIDHYNAKTLFERDVTCIRDFFRRRFSYESEAFPDFEEDVKREESLDVEIAASGYRKIIESKREDEDLMNEEDTNNKEEQDYNKDQGNEVADVQKDNEDIKQSSQQGNIDDTSEPKNCAETSCYSNQNNEDVDSIENDLEYLVLSEDEKENSKIMAHERLAELSSVENKWEMCSTVSFCKTASTAATVTPAYARQKIAKEFRNKERNASERLAKAQGRAKVIKKKRTENKNDIKHDNCGVWG